MRKLLFLFPLLSTLAQAEWKKHVVTEAKGMINSAVAADWNADGKIDVIASLDGKVVLFTGPDWKAHTLHDFRPGLSRNKPRSACIHSCLMDVDGDGDQDFIGSNNTVFWLECPDNPLAGPWKYRTVDDEILGTHCLITGDVNRDGKPDLIANSGRAAKQTSIPNSLTWLEVPQNPRTAKSWIRHVFAKGDAPGGSHYTGFGDVNGDGLPDISCAAKGGDRFPGGQWFAWWEQSKDGKLPWKKHLLADKQPGATNILPADLDGDKHIDYFATRGHGQGVLWFKGPDFKLIEIDPKILVPHSLDLADLDNDGDIDAVTCSKDPVDVAAWYENNGKGQFTKRIIGRKQGSYDTRAIDMDDDGDLDVLIAGHTSNNVVWYENPLGKETASADWPQASGPDGNFIVQGEAPTDFSGATGMNVKWRVYLPNTGQSAAIVSDERIFVTSHEPITQDTETGAAILGMCFDAKTGKELWRRTIPGTRETDLSSLFNDNTAYSPVADGKRVVFTNVGGAIKCFDYDGNEQWSHTWTPFGRHHARAHEPILHDGKVILLHAPTYDLPVTATTKAGSKSLGRAKQYWTHLRAYSLATGKLAWQAEPGTSVHALSMLGKLPDGRAAILTGRGGGHKPPEEPYGLSLIDAATGKALWNTAIEKFPCHQNTTFKKDAAYYFANGQHGALDLATGKLRGTHSLVEGVTITRWQNGEYVTLENQTLPRGPKAKKSFTYFTNLIVGDYHYFRAFSGFLIGRVQLPTGKVEYLQVPAQIVRKKGQPDEMLWDKSLPNDMKNANGFRATQDKRNAGSGWGHVTAAPPIVVGKYIYWPTMVGTVYVLDWTASRLNEKALISVSDLGPAGETWSLSSLTFAGGRLYARTLKELVCFEN